MMCAIRAGKRGRSVLLLDHAKKLGGKILISGGGRCNFTNLGASPNQYVSENPHFCKSAFSRFSPQDFIQLVEEHRIAYHEKKLGQQFCDESAQQIVEMLHSECIAAGAKFQLECKVNQITRDEGYTLETNLGTYHCDSLVVATGGLSIPKIGATGFGYEIARQFGLKIIPTRPALDGFTLNHQDAGRFGDLAGLSADTIITTNGISFRENILFTHAGLSGPATLQASLHWNSGDPVQINLFPDLKLFDWLMKKKKEGNKSQVKNLLSEVLASRLAERFCEVYYPDQKQMPQPLPDVSEKMLEVFCNQLQAWTIIPSGTVGYSKAEVTRGGVDTQELSSKTMEAKKAPGLYFIGEVVDVTGWLGGYNFQWAWASGAAAGEYA